MRFSYLLALIVTVSLVGVQWYQTTKYICPIPINYRLGVIDDSFSITESEAKQYIKQAVAIWEEAADQDLFIYNQEADFVINFVFDERQATADAQTSDRERLDAIALQNEEFRTQISGLQSSYETRQENFNSAKDEYDTDLRLHNEQVQQANDRGGASPTVFTKLESERERLAAVSDGLRLEADSLNNLASQLNNLSNEGNQLIETYNREVRAYNDEYGESHEFTQGDYRGGEINVYKFSNEHELVSVLAHEFGHALGIDHIEEPGSLMYYLLDDELDQAQTLSEEDIAALATECSDLGLGAHVRGLIREALAKF